MIGSKLLKTKYLIDSVILIDHLNGIKKASTWLKKHGESQSAISVITRAEILAGSHHNEKHIIEALLAKFSCLPIDERTASLAADLRIKYKFKLPDAFQTAIALSNNLILVTRNTKDFKSNMVFVNIPYQIK
jgi:predicted nucleic acid-binding protein